MDLPRQRWGGSKSTHACLFQQLTIVFIYFGVLHCLVIVITESTAHKNLQEPKMMFFCRSTKQLRRHLICNDTLIDQQQVAPSKAAHHSYKSMIKYRSSENTSSLYTVKCFKCTFIFRIFIPLYQTPLTKTHNFSLCFYVTSVFLVRDFVAVFSSVVFRCFWPSFLTTQTQINSFSPVLETAPADLCESLSRGLEPG